MQFNGQISACYSSSIISKLALQSVALKIIVFSTVSKNSQSAGKKNLKELFFFAVAWKNCN